MAPVLGSSHQRIPRPGEASQVPAQMNESGQGVVVSVFNVVYHCTLPP